MIFEWNADVLELCIYQRQYSYSFDRSFFLTVIKYVISYIRILLPPIYIYIQVSQEECARLREGVPYVKVYRYNPKHLCPKLNGYGDNGQRSLKL